MPPTSGSRLGPYEVGAPLGAGGMGEVYRARDTRLDRDVALKILPALFASDPDRLARFEREAKTLASLNHPHIAQIYGFEQSGGTSALVMELVDGEDLAARLARGPIAVGEALAIARQIADALEAAHEHGIVHRDLKPANIKIRPDGTVKVLDFGLAKAPVPVSSIEPANSPTFTVAATQLGTILGTAAYMSPEQARGKAVDKRADIWAFGCVLYEMLTGHQPFGGETVTDVLAAVVEREPDWIRLRASIPPPVRRVLRRCLEKDPRRRLADIADARLEIEDALAGREERAAERQDRRRMSLVWPAACVAAAAALMVSGGSLLRTPAPSVNARFTVALPAGDVLADSRLPLLALSPDGQSLVYTAVRDGVRRLFRRSLDAFDPEPIAGTEGAEMPFFSPDGASLGFFTAQGVRKMPFPSGAAVQVAPARGPAGPFESTASFARGASFMRDATVVYAPFLFGPLAFVPPGRGEPLMLENSAESGALAADGSIPETTLQIIQHWPDALPDGMTILSAEGGHDLTSWDGGRIVAQTLDNRTPVVILEGGTHPRYAPTGHLLYAHRGSIMAAPFDLKRLRLTGTAVRVLDGVAQSNAGAAQYTFSTTGTLAYVDGSAQTNEHTLAWVDRNGQAEPLKMPPGHYWSPDISPDGRQIAYSLFGPGDVWTYDIARETSTRLAVGAQKARSAAASHPRWTPDGRRIAYEQVRDGRPASLYWRSADGSDAEERLTSGTGSQTPNCWLPDGKSLFYTEQGASTGQDLWVLPVEGERTPRPFLRTPFNEFGAACSPDGRWIAYVSDESGGWEIYVRPSGGSGERIKMSNGGGMSPLWTRDGKSLLYFSTTSDNPLVLMSVSVAPGDRLHPGRAVPLLRGRYYWEPGRNFDIAADGRLLLMPVSTRTPAVGSIRIVQGWFDELRRIAPD